MSRVVSAYYLRFHGVAVRTVHCLMTCFRHKVTPLVFRRVPVARRRLLGVDLSQRCIPADVSSKVVDASFL